jgi:hypothetical protein
MKSLDKPPRAPNGSKAAGQRLWHAVLSGYELAEHEMTLLVQACRVADVCDELQTLVDADGPVTGKRVNPAIVELRQQRVVLAKLIVALRVPLGDQEIPSKTGAPRLQRRGTRGFYQARGSWAS